ncbi:hypothetical protein C2E23DRAFT_869287 [Lenzites betulinus]|nr:hypothetical protein C2E23DRAFT_869287 [Lenzites betulinus]
MSISERLYIRWLPDPASEPTSTLVLTAPRTRKFVDLRLFTPTPFTALEWGIAGRSVGTPTHGKWVHEISSRTARPEDEADEGDMAPHPTLPGVELESGRMVHPGSGKVREYEEAWKAVPVLPVGGEGERVAVLLEMRGEGVGGGRRGAVVRVGQVCQGIVRDGEEVSVQRWEWAEGEWRETARIGRFEIPCDVTWAGVKEGDSVERGGVVWDVNEVALF